MERIYVNKIDQAPAKLNREMHGKEMLKMLDTKYDIDHYMYA